MKVEAASTKLWFNPEKDIKKYLTPEEIVTHHLPLEDAARGYDIFAKREEECRKVILVPGMAATQATI